MRVTVGTIVGLVAAGRSFGEILAAYPYLEEEDIRQALAYAAWRVEEIEVPLPKAASSSHMTWISRCFLPTARPVNQVLF